MEAIYIPQLLKLPGRKEEIKFQDSISGLDTLTPVKGVMSIRHGGTFLEVLAQAETIVTLTCDRCLQNYNHRLSINTSEIIWLEEEKATEDSFLSEKEVSLEDLSETLPPNGYFQPSVWLYEQLSLAMPMQKVCGQDCRGADSPKEITESVVDSRWSSLAALKEQLSKNYEL
ncbi:MAG: YceD family protein [Xenococcaceae cyanobacterium MO_188.B29]|nr:YceD family protein [Xenococcaceae cyanobacterium MO_188.B29]